MLWWYNLILYPKSLKAGQWGGGIIPASDAGVVVMQVLGYSQEVALQRVDSLPAALTGEAPQLAEGAHRVLQPPAAVPLVQLRYKLLVPTTVADPVSGAHDLRFHK